MASGSEQNALISVYDKTGIEAFAEGLHELDWNIYASGGTFNAITKSGIPAQDVAELVGGEAILGHKVVTLSREIGAGLLSDLSDPKEMEEMRRLGLPVIHLVCQDSYPLEETIARPDATDADILLQSDIGGPTMLREAAKGRRIVLSVPEQRQAVLDWLKAGKPDEAAFVQQLANRAVYEVARYSLIEARHWNGDDVSGHIALKNAPTKYGENPQQENAAFYADNRVAVDPLGLDQFQHVQGMERSYVNMTDIDRLLQTSTHIAAGFERNFGEVPPMVVGVKHGNACCAGALGDSHEEAIRKAIESDTRAIFGGVIMINGSIDKAVAEALLTHAVEDGKTRLLDGVIGSSVTDEALELLSRKKLRVIVNPALANLSEDSLDTSRRTRPVRGGVLEQPNYTFVQDLSAEHMQQFGEITESQKRDLVLAWAVGCTSNSNTITIAKDGVIIGNGVGQQDRVGAGQLALSRTTIEMPEITRNEDTISLNITLDTAKLEDAVAYSDSFFPFPDGPELLADAGITAILTSSGSTNDKIVIDALTQKGVGILMVPDKIGRGFYQH